MDKRPRYPEEKPDLSPASQEQLTDLYDLLLQKQLERGQFPLVTNNKIVEIVRENIDINDKLDDHAGSESIVINFYTKDEDSNVISWEFISLFRYPGNLIAAYHKPPAPYTDELWENIVPSGMELARRIAAKPPIVPNATPISPEEHERTLEYLLEHADEIQDRFEASDIEESVYGDREETITASYCDELKNLALSL